MDALYIKARDFAVAAHKDQYRKGTVNGQVIPFVWHPLDVASRCNDDVSKAVACLHDVVEDTTISLEDLRNAGFPEEVVLHVGHMTKQEGLEYLDYIRNQILFCPVCERIKVEDIWSNWGTLTEEMINRKLYRRYMKALLLILRIYG